MVLTDKNIMSHFGKDVTGIKGLEVLYHTVIGDILTKQRRRFRTRQENYRNFDHLFNGKNTWLCISSRPKCRYNWSSETCRTAVLLVSKGDVIFSCQEYLNLRCF